ncbi:aminopeptidase P family protein [Flavobacteriaceae bacterium]|nr:aminopeptidase P family protein [Flavobacteriaceae bacterium]MDB9830873.1 aminopeptidase P family protein [Flavobacteriaceae bacterium]MDC0107556.1 aminopeptidase P family protein [Flavobacteriaceae bacterium]MDC0119587.1 aminopeptidase P family protein [Flavobacteriaceae bacterium]
MKYQAIPNTLFIKNRQKFTAQMISGSLAVFNSNDIYPVSADSTLPFAQHSDILYLSGADQEESILLLFPDALNPAHREILFVRETNEHIAVWEGAKYTKEKATAISGIQTIMWLSDFDKVFFDLMTEAHTIYFNTNEHYRQAVETQTREDRFIAKCKAQFPAHQWQKSQPILQEIRGVKEAEEIAQMQTACNITGKGIRRLLGFIKPGVWEYEIEAELLHEFVRNRSKGFAYTPIIASGANANVLHYIENNQQCQAGDLILMDVAAEYANYRSDLTRTFPVSGRFTERQAAVYNAVLRVKNAATKMLVPGTLWAEYHREVGEIMTAELLALGLLDPADVKNQDPNKPAYKKYFMHGTSHHIGLDTHDYGALKTPMKAGMVFTVEPGIYIPEEGIGIRLEDNVVIQEKGDPINLMAHIPITVAEIEALMNGEG